MYKLLAYVALVAVSTVASTLPEASTLPKRQGRIVGGFDVEEDTQFPHQASLRTLGNLHFCGGSIITNRWILSSAHCTIGRAQNSLLIVIGTVNLSVSNGTVHQSVRIVNHPNFNANNFANDVSIVQTQDLIVFNEAVQAIALGSDQHGVSTAIVTGWGGTDQSGGGPKPVRLQGLNTRTMTNVDCRSRHTVSNSALIFDHKICSFTQSGEGACQGDTGGALITQIGNVQTQIGIISWSIPCGVGWPDVSDRVSHFLTWITDTIAG